MNIRATPFKNKLSPTQATGELLEGPLGDPREASSGGQVGIVLASKPTDREFETRPGQRYTWDLKKKSLVPLRVSGGYSRFFLTFSNNLLSPKVNIRDPPFKYKLSPTLATGELLEGPLGTREK